MTQMGNRGHTFEVMRRLNEWNDAGVAQRSGKTIEWDAETMKVGGQPEFDAWIKEPAREGWGYGENLWP